MHTVPPDWVINNHTSPEVIKQIDENNNDDDDDDDFGHDDDDDDDVANHHLYICIYFNV